MSFNNFSSSVKLNNIKTYSGVKATNNSFKNTFYSDIKDIDYSQYEEIDYNAINLEEGIEKAKNEKEWYEVVLEWDKKIKATQCVVATTLFSGVLKIVEYADDGLTWVGGMATSGIARLIGQEDFAEQIEEATMDEIARDKVGELNEAFYEKTEIGRSINEASAMKYDSELAKSIQNVTTEVVVIAGATAATVVTGGAAAPLFVAGFAIGAGQSAENKFQDTENRDFWKDSVEIGVDGTIKGLSTMAYGKAGATAVNGVKSLSNLGLSGIKEMGKTTLKSFSKDAIGTTLKNSGKTIVKNTAIQTLKDKDTWLETGAVLLDDVKTGVQTGEWNVGAMLADAALIYGENYIGNLAGGIAGDVMNNSKNLSPTTNNVSPNNMVPKMDYNTSVVVNRNTVEDNILEVLSRHDSKYGQGDALKRINQFLDPNNSNFGNYNMITSSNDAREIFEMYTPEQIRHALNNLGYSSNSRNISGYFSSLGGSKTGNYGADQGGIAALCEYTYNGNKYTYRQAMELYNDALNNNRPLPHFQKAGTQEYFNLKNKLISQGFTARDASVIMSTVDDAGACSYAATVNEIFASYAGREYEFQQKFGYSMYKVENGKTVLNSNELLLDLYVNSNKAINGGGFILGDNSLNPYLLKNDRFDVFGRQMLDAENQVYMSSLYSGKNVDSVSNFLNSKGINYSSERLMLNTGGVINDNNFYDMLNKTYNEINSGKSITLDIFSSGNTINMNSTNPNLYPSTSTATWGEGGGHSIFVTGMGTDCFYVSSWGKEYSIPFSDLQNGGVFNIFSATIT